MTVSIRQTRNGVSIRTTGDDAARVLCAVSTALAPQPPTVGRKGVPNRSKAAGRATGASEPCTVRMGRNTGEQS